MLQIYNINVIRSRSIQSSPNAISLTRYRNNPNFPLMEKYRVKHIRSKTFSLVLITLFIPFNLRFDAKGGKLSA